jgi:hypothetical protein
VIWRLASILVLCIVLFEHPARAQQFRVVNPQFSRLALKDYTVIGPAVNDTISRAVLRPQGKLFFSFTVLGDRTTCRYLEENDQLEIRVVLFAGIVYAKTYNLDITQEKWEDIGPAVQGQCSAQEMFTYRARLFTRRIDQRSITVHIRGVDGHNVLSHTVTIEP